MNTNTKLLVILLLLAAGSVWAYTDSVSRGDRFALGQKLLPNLNPDEIAIIEIIDGEDEVILRREGDSFTIKQAHDYLARNDAVNRFLRDLLDIGLQKEVGTGASLAEALEIEPRTDSTTEIALINNAQQEMVRLRLGKTFDEGNGRYVQRIDQEDAPIYLTTKSAFLSTTVDSFLKKELVDHSQMLVKRIAGPDFLIAKPEDGSLELEGVPAGKREKSAETGKLKSMLSRLRFDKPYLADDEEVADVVFEWILEIDLDDQSGYQLALGTREERSFLRIHGKHDVQQVAITRDTPEEELKDKADTLARVTEIDEFNAFHDSWTYEISSFTAAKLKLRKSDLIEDDD